MEKSKLWTLSREEEPPTASSSIVGNSRSSLLSCRLNGFPSRLDRFFPVSRKGVSDLCSRTLIKWASAKLGGNARIASRPFRDEKLLSYGVRTKLRQMADQDKDAGGPVLWLSGPDWPRWVVTRKPRLSSHGRRAVVFVLPEAFCLARRRRADGKFAFSSPQERAQ